MNKTYERDKRRRLRTALDGQSRACPDCEKEHKSPGYCGQRCSDCFRLKETKRKSQWRAQNRVTDRARTSRWNRNHREKVAAAKKRQSHTLRASVINAYGGICACRGCRISVTEFLSIDHIDNTGAKHRRQLGNTQAVYRWLKNHRFPKKNFQLLCRNCNMGKSEHGVCPRFGKSHMH